MMLEDWTSERKVDLAVEMAKRVYFEHSAGGRLHICLDDGNLDAELFRWCIYDFELPTQPTWAEWSCAEVWRQLTEAEMKAAYARRREYQGGNPASAIWLMVA